MPSGSLSTSMRATISETLANENAPLALSCEIRANALLPQLAVTGSFPQPFTGACISMCVSVYLHVSVCIQMYLYVSVSYICSCVSLCLSYVYPMSIRCLSVSLYLVSDVRSVSVPLRDLWQQLAVDRLNRTLNQSFSDYERELRARETAHTSTEYGLSVEKKITFVCFGGFSFLNPALSSHSLHFKRKMLFVVCCCGFFFLF